MWTSPRRARARWTAYVYMVFIARVIRDNDRLYSSLSYVSPVEFEQSYYPLGAESCNPHRERRENLGSSCIPDSGTGRCAVTSIT